MQERGKKEGREGASFSSGGARGTAGSEQAWQKTRSADDCYNSGGHGRKDRGKGGGLATTTLLIITPLMIILHSSLRTKLNEYRVTAASRRQLTEYFPHFPASSLRQISRTSIPRLRCLSNAFCVVVAH